MKIATRMKKLHSWQGDAFVYRLTPPLDSGTEFVVVSAVDLPLAPGGYRDSETMIFSCDEAGDNVDFGELAMVPEKNHAAALADLDYAIAEV